MAESEAAQERVETTAEELEQKYQDDAEVYARTRSEAARTRGNQAGHDHWEQVAETLQQDANDDDG